MSMSGREKWYWAKIEIMLNYRSKTILDIKNVQVDP